METRVMNTTETDGTELEPDFDGEHKDRIAGLLGGF
jgi:hypothetical protein